jgi:hypothetical protein
VEHYGIQGGVKVFWKKSNPAKKSTQECMRCGYRKIYHNEIAAELKAGLGCERCDGPTTLIYTREGEKPSMTIRPTRPAVTEKKKNNDLQIKVEVDTSEMDAAIEKAKQLNELTKEYEDRTKHKDDALDPIANAMAAIKHIQSEYGPDKKDKLLVIELDDIHSVPRIVHKGDEITKIMDVQFEWSAKYDDSLPKSFRINYFDEEERCIKTVGSSK